MDLDHEDIPYSWKYWRSLNLAVWPQTNHKKYWQNLNLVMASQVCLSKSIVISHLRYLNKAMSLQFTRNKTGSVLAPS